MSQWTYHQNSGLLLLDAEEVDYGWSGYEDGINIPAMQDMPGLGPLPRGMWVFEGPPFDHPECGFYCLRLTPAVSTQTFGRNSFLCHGRSSRKPFDSSKGCLVFVLETRKRIWESGVRPLEVLA
jgi:hypothetical protein